MFGTYSKGNVHVVYRVEPTLKAVWRMDLVMKWLCSRYKKGKITVQSSRQCGTRAMLLQLLATSKRSCAYKQKTIRLQANDHLLTSNYFPTQKCEKMLLRVSWGVIWPPVISERISRVWWRSSERRSPERPLLRPSMTLWMLTAARWRAS